MPFNRRTIEKNKNLTYIALVRMARPYITTVLFINKLTISLLLLIGIHTPTSLYAVSSKKKKKKQYTENLAIHKIIFNPVATTKQKKIKNQPKQVMPLHTVNTQLDRLLNKRKIALEAIPTIPGYTIQVYLGDSRSVALQVKSKLYLQHPSYTPTIHYNPPNYTVCVGAFLDKLEAYPLFIALKKKQPQALIKLTYFASNYPISSYPGTLQNPAQTEHMSTIDQSE